MWIDAHCHLDAKYWPEGPDAVLARARAEGVTGFVVVGVDGASVAADAVSLAARHPDVWAVVGVHPHEASTFRQTWPEIAALLSQDRVVALGETGLDRHYDFSPVSDQRVAFRETIAAARTAHLPLVIHTREAPSETLEVLVSEQARDVGGVIHCFDADRDFARAALDLGFYLSFSGMVTHRKRDHIRDVASWAPLDRILVETDSPYLVPEPLRQRLRGRPCEPAFVVHTGRRVAELRGMSEEALAAATTANATRLFGLAGAGSGVGSAPPPGDPGRPPG
jgi:TatD DNase family protein